MKKHLSKINDPAQRELFGANDYGAGKEHPWLILQPNGKPDRPAMKALHDSKRKEGHRKDQRDLARFLSGTPHQKLSYLLSDFEATESLDGPWEATQVIMNSITRFPRSHELRYELHYLHMKLENLMVAAYWLKEAIRVERLLKPDRKRKVIRKPGTKAEEPRVMERGPPRTIHYFFYACPFTWGEEKWEEDEEL